MNINRFLSVDSIEKNKSTAIFYSLYDSYKNFCGIYEDIKFDISKLCLETIIDDVKRELYLSQGDDSEESINIFFDFHLWKLDLEVLYCLEDADEKKRLLKKFAYNDALNFRLQNADGLRIDYMKTYLRYLILCINTHGEDALMSSKDLLECYNLANHCVRKLQTTNNISYQSLLCKLFEKYREPVEVEEYYNHLFRNLRTNLNYNHLLSMAYYNFSRYLENLSAIQRMRLGANIKIESYYEKAYLIDPGNYKAQYKLIFYKTREKDQNYHRIKSLKKFILVLIKLVDNDQGCIRIYLYIFKTYYSLGLLYKQIGESNKALEYFINAESVFHEVIEPIWEDMGMNEDNNSSKKALLDYLNFMLLSHQRIMARFEVEDETKRGEIL